jgi:hypothetical protein
MTYVCLWSPAVPTGAASAAELAPALLEIAPRVHVGVRGVVWADARGLDARPLARALLDTLRAAGASARTRAAIAATPVAAEVAAMHGAGEPILEVPPGEDRAYLAPFPLSVLVPPRELVPLLDGTGLEYCADLARLEQAAVEVRFGPVGVALWRLARADDRRLLFAPRPRPLPHASLEWTDYVLHDPERLLFVVNRLVGSVCTALRERGEGAGAFTLAFALAGGANVEERFLPSRAGADQPTWIRLVRDRLERIHLPDGVVAVELRVERVLVSETTQGDILDRGFASAGAAADALARLLDRGATIVTPERSRHPLPARRTRWTTQDLAFVWARPQLGPGDTEPALVLHRLTEPEPVEVATHDRAGFAVPLRYRSLVHGSHEGWHELVTASGPDCLSGGQWESAWAWEAYCCMRTDGELVQLCYDARSARWELHGTWR